MVFQKESKVVLQNQQRLTHIVEIAIPSPKSEILGSLPPFQSHQNASDFHAVGAGLRHGGVEATSKNRLPHWSLWSTYVQPLGVDPFLPDTP